jgi:drug/metabolite transporter (DMT)-like permease
MLRENVIGITAALGSAASWAVGSFLFKSLGEVFSPLAMTLSKGVFSLVLLGAVLMVMGPGSQGLDSFAMLALSGLLGIALGDTFFFEALSGLGPQPLLVLAVLGQVLTVISAVLFLHESPTLGAWTGVALVIIGVTVVLRGKLTGDERATGLRGIGFGLLAVICMCASNLVAKAALREGSDTIAATFIRMAAGTLGVLLLGLTTHRLKAWVSPFRDLRMFRLFLIAVVVVTFGGFWLSMVAYKYMPVSIASSLTSTEPVFALILAAILWKERPSLPVLVGTLATVLGVALISLPGADLPLEGSSSSPPLAAERDRDGPVNRSGSKDSLFSEVGSPMASHGSFYLGDTRCSPSRKIASREPEVAWTTWDGSRSWG